MAEGITALIADGGYVSVFLLMLAENVFPPIPSEIILPFVGLSIANGTLSPLPALLAATLGSVAGTTFWFAIGWYISAERLRNFFTKFGGYVAIRVTDFDKAISFFTKYQVQAVFFGRMVPTVRTVISIPAGSVRMSPKRFLFYTTVGTVIWNMALMTAGFFLEDVTALEPYIGLATNVVVASFVLVYVLQVIRFHITKPR